MEGMPPRLIEVFFEVQRGLPRQGPGNEECTAKAFELCTELPQDPSILDLGCGPGMQTIALASVSSGKILAADNCEEYLGELRQRIDGTSLTERIEIKNADMSALDLPVSSFDLIWCEGAAYNVGISNALESWRPLLREDGYLVFSELVWLTEDPPAEVLEFFNDEYPAMTTVPEINRVIRANSYKPLADFTLPDSAWFDDYYSPLETKLPALKQKYAKDSEALLVVAATETEIDMRHRFSQHYGYQFFVTRRTN